VTRGLPPPDPRSLCPLSSTEFVEPPPPPLARTKFLGTPLHVTCMFHEPTCLHMQATVIAYQEQRTRCSCPASVHAGLTELPNLLNYSTYWTTQLTELLNLLNYPTDWTTQPTELLSLPNYSAYRNTQLTELLNLLDYSTCWTTQLTGLLSLPNYTT
jgi:hypothetical protein